MVGSVDVEAGKDAEAPNGPHSLRTTGYAVESSGKLWSVYLTESDRHDKALAESWKADMDGLLIFAGLFSAVVTAFLVGSLQQMTQSNQTPGASPSPGPTLANPSTLLRVNVLWCSSLFSSLLSALCATLVQQWARQYTQALDQRTAAHQRARVRAFLLQGIERSGVKAVVEGAPALLHLAMFLFIAGLIDIIAPASRMLSLLSLIVLVVIVAFYLALSWFPLHDLQSPYRTPLSSALWYIKQAVRPLNFTNVEGWTVVVKSGSLSHGREEYATATVDGTQERDLASLSWTLSSLIDRGDCEPFIEGIAGFMRSEKVVGASVIMHELVKRKDLARHILELLVNCIEPAHDSMEVRRRQSISGLSALRALTANWFSDDAGVTLQDGDPHGVWKWSYSFPEKVIDVTMNLRSVSDAVISMHARCTAAVAVWRVLVDYDELGAYTKQKLVTVERLLSYLESTRDKGRRSGRRTRVRDKIKEKINHDLLAVWAQSTQSHIETLRTNSPQSDRAQIQNWETEKADLKMMRYLWEQNMCPPEAWLYGDIELQHNETDNGESSMLDSVLAYLSSHAKLLHRTLKPLESSQHPLNAYVDEATECLDQWSSATMKELMPRIIASGHVANTIQLINHAIKGPRRSDADQITILETLETITVPIRALQGKLNERSQRSLLGLLKFLKEQHLDAMFRDIDNLSGSIFQLIVKIGEKIIPLAVRGLGTPNLWQSAQAILIEYEDTCPDLADTLSDAQTWIRGKLLHYQFSTAPQSSRKPLLLTAPSEPRSSPGTHPRPLSKPAAPRAGPLSPDSEQSSKPKAQEVGLSQSVPSEGRRNAHKILQPLYSPSGRLLEHYIDVPVEPEQGKFIDTVGLPRESTSSNRRNSVGSWAAWKSTVQPPSPSPSSKRGSVGPLRARKPHDGAPTSPLRLPSPSPSDGRGREGWWTARGSHDGPLTSRARSPSSLSPSNRRGSAGSAAAQKSHEGAPTSPTQPSSPSSSSSSSNSGAAASLEPFAPLMQASTSLQTAITAQTEPAQDTSTKPAASLPVVVVQRREGSGSGSWSRPHSSRASSPTSLAPAIPPAPRPSIFGPRSPQSSPPITPPPERNRSSSPPNSGRPSRPPTLSSIAGHGLGLYIPRESPSGPLSLSASDTRFHTPVESSELGVGTQAYPLDPAAPPASTATSAYSHASAAAVSASIPLRSHWTNGQEHHAEGSLPSAASLVSRASESGDGVAVGNGDAGRGDEVELDSRTSVNGVLEAAGGKVDESRSRSRSASGGSNDGSGKSKRASRSADELQQASGLASVQIDSPPSSPHESWNADAGIVTHPDQRPLQDVGTDASIDAHSPKQELEMSTLSSSPTGLVD